MSMFKEAAVAAALLLAVALGVSACTSPREAGLELGETHAEAVREESITVERLVDELEAARAEHAPGEARESFEAGYREGIAPVKEELAALALEESATELGKQVGALGAAAGAAIGEAVRRFEGAAEELKEVDEDMKDDMREAGREVGRVVKGLKGALEAFTEGLEEEIEKE